MKRTARQRSPWDDSSDSSQQPRAKRRARHRRQSTSSFTSPLPSQASDFSGDEVAPGPATVPLPLQPLTGAIARFRRPETTNERDFWHCSQQRWDSWILAVRSGVPGTKPVESAKNNLRKYDVAGRIMEVEGEGEPAPYPDGCLHCRRGRRGVVTMPCWVSTKGESVACAFCRCQAKSGCIAGRPTSGTDDLDEDLYGVSDEEERVPVVVKTEPSSPDAPRETTQLHRVTRRSGAHSTGVTALAEARPSHATSSTGPPQLDEDESGNSAQDPAPAMQRPAPSSGEERLATRIMELEQRLNSQDFASLIARVEQLEGWLRAVAGVTSQALQSGLAGGPAANPDHIHRAGVNRPQSTADGAPPTRSGFLALN